MAFAFLIALLAGLATSIGGWLGTHKRLQRRSLFAAALAFAAGAMLFVSFVEIVPLGISELSGVMSAKEAQLLTYGLFLLGIVIVGLIDRFLPHSLNPSEIEGKEASLPDKDTRANKKLLRSGLLVALVLALHNFPEGMSTFFAAYEDASLGITLAIAIAIHNIPEGIAVAAPIYRATGSRRRAFWWATASGLAEPLGALVGAWLVLTIVPAAYTGVVFGLIAGMMVFVAIDELLPAARRYQTDKHQVVYGLLAGMAIVGLSLVLMS